MPNPPDFLLDAIDKKLVVQYTLGQEVHRLEPAMCARIHGNMGVVFGRSSPVPWRPWEATGEWKIVRIQNTFATDCPLRFEDAPAVPQDMLELVVKVLGRER